MLAKKEKIINKIDYSIIIAVFLLMFIGIICIYSATVNEVPGQSGSKNFIKQVYWAILGFSLMIFVFFIPLKVFEDLAYPLHILFVLILTVVLIAGSMSLGARRWLQIGSFRFQPSEFAKIFAILVLARFLSNEKVDLTKLKYLFITIIIILIPVALILKQPDLGTSLAFLSFLFPILLWAGMQWFTFFVICAPLLSVLGAFNFYSFLAVILVISLVLYFSKKPAPIITFHFTLNILVGLLTQPLWNSLKPYQQKRILIFLDPSLDPKGAGYQVIQSQVAIGSGGLSGKGFLEGTQTQLRFLPEQHTDFIFSVVGEEFGFIGSVFVLLLLWFIIYKAIKIAYNSKDRFGSFVAIGIAFLLIFHVFINIGMTLGIMPVTGVPLPFVSYGGSAMLTNMFLIGLLLNIGKKN
jgi:rod shape determining protein RodA